MDGSLFGSLAMQWGPGVLLTGFVGWLFWWHVRDCSARRKDFFEIVNQLRQNTEERITQLAGDVGWVRGFLEGRQAKDE